MDKKQLNEMLSNYAWTVLVAKKDLQDAQIKMREVEEKGKEIDKIITESIRDSNGEMTINMIIKGE